MAQYVINSTDLDAIAAAIRSKSGSANSYTVDEMPAAILALSAGSAVRYNDIYLNGVDRDNNTHVGKYNMWVFDTTDYNTFKFKFDYYNAADADSLDIKIYYGYELSAAGTTPITNVTGNITGYTLIPFELVQVDENARYSEIPNTFFSLEDGTNTGIVNEFNVSDYTSIVLIVDIHNSNMSAKIYDIELS